MFIPRESFNRSKYPLFSTNQTDFFNYASYGSQLIREIIRPMLTHHFAFNEKYRINTVYYFKCVRDYLGSLDVKQVDRKVLETVIDQFSLKLILSSLETDAKLKKAFNYPTIVHNLTNIQLFFVKFAQSLCSKTKTPDVTETDYGLFYEYIGHYLSSKKR